MKNVDSKNKKVVVGISGGVDSAVSALLLKKQGYEVVGAYMKLWREKNSVLEAKSGNEEENARKVAQEVGIDFIVFDLQKEFKKEIVDYFVSEYASGRTPNPCVKCNREIKFGLFFKKALEIGADFVATGHYVKIKKNVGGRYRLVKAKDGNKDQSYFLYNLKQNQLKKIFFPLGGYTKTEVRQIAFENGLHVHNKSESQEICFVSDKYYGDFLRRQKIKLNSGNIVNEKGEVLGKHQGLPLYTLGQRRDIRIGGTGPYFVVGIDYKKNELIVSGDKNSENLFAKVFKIKEINWVSGQKPDLPLKVKVRTRYRMDAISAEISGHGRDTIVRLVQKSRAIAPGQSAVFYFRNEVLGGGVIDKIIE
jgi:tRNA-specific 2-thiouridylase